MNNRTSEIIIGVTGEIQIDAVGFKGPGREKTTAFLGEALGVVGKKVKKPEYLQHSTRLSQERIGFWLLDLRSNLLRTSSIPGETSV